MSQERTDDLAVHLGLQGFTIESVESLRQGSGVVKVVHLLRGSDRYVCSECGKSFTESLFDEHERIRFRDCSIGDAPTARPGKAGAILWVKNPPGARARSPCSLDGRLEGSR